jgi:hypothetical protein
MRTFSYFSSLLWLLSTVVFQSQARIIDERGFRPKTEIVPAQESNAEHINALYMSSKYGLDAQHVYPINNETWEWYYFDAVSHDGLHCVSVIMYTAPQTAFFGGGPPNSIIIASLFASTPDNEQFYFDQNGGDRAIITTLGNGASGKWDGNGFQFTGSSDLKTYSINIDAPDIFLKGHMKLKSVSSKLIWRNI